MNTVYKGKTISFWELINEHKIEIPIIQRDYAQGRLENTDIRQNFLHAIKDCLTNKIIINLDFIYGNIDGETFQPLDGQQRLTTLFLLHWYAAKRINSPISDINFLSKFTYETRISSREFCNALVSCNIGNSEIVENTILSNVIINSSWFFLSWKKDPTINSMLGTIDDIHRDFFEIDDLWERLTADNLVKFYYVELENIGLTDDLYIRMNARGKLLTRFENFKASFQQIINENGWEEEKDIKDKFSFKIDTCWTDYFWANFKKNSSVDTAHMRLISTVAMYKIALDKSIKAEERYQTIQRLNDDPDYIRPYHYTKSTFEYLYTCYEIYCNIEKRGYNLLLDVPFWRHQPKSSILSEIVYEDSLYSQTQRSSYTLKVLLYAQTEYLRRIDKFDYSRFSDWMRVIRNIISRGDVDKDGKRPDIIRSPQTFDGIISLINELAEGCSDIYSYLSSITSLKSTFAKEQLDEEKLKSRIIVSRPELRQLIWKTEDNELLRGRISFVFYCINFREINDELDVTMLSRIQEVFEKYFNNEAEISPDLRRAMLTIEVDGEYCFYDYWWSFWNVVNATKRKLFDKYRELEYFIYSEQREYFKKLIIQLTEKDLKQIISDFNPPKDMPIWKVRLIKDPLLLGKKSKSNYIAIPLDNSCCYLLKSRRPRDMEGCNVIG